MNLSFPPPRQPGITLHVVLIVLLAVAGWYLIWQATGIEVSVTLTIIILLAGLALFPVPFLIYRLYALARASYALDRDKLTISWGLRVEQIPVSDVEWVRPESDLIGRLPKPPLRLPGSVLGTRRHPDLGPIEFIAADAGGLLLIATARRIFAISPADVPGFVQNVQRAMEMGSLAPSPAQSLYPAFVIAQAWESLAARFLWLAGLLINVGMLLWVSLMTQSLGMVPFGFLPTGAPAGHVPAAQMIILPLSSIAFFLLSWGVGLTFFRRVKNRMAAYVVWTGGLSASLLFLLAVMFIVTTPG
ncbi:MAG: PH domain-containing protein [Anaerolineales bacterium]|nr:PH domain-containing protein [Anaerolineales bacterium]